MNKLAKTIEYLFYLFIFLLPAQTRWIWHYGKLGEGTSEYLTFSLYGTEIVLFVILILALVYKIKIKDEEITFLNYKILDFYILIFLFVIFGALSVFWALDKKVTLYYLIKSLEGLALLIFIVNFRFSYKKVGWAFILGGLGQSLLAIYQFLTQSVWANKWLGMASQAVDQAGTFVVESGNFRWLRAYGTLPHPNILGGYLIVCFLILTILLFLAKRKWQKILLWLFLPLILSGLFFTFSKSAFLALAVGFIYIAILVFISPDRRTKLILSQIILVSILVMGVLAFIYQDAVFARAKGDARLELKSQQERLLYIEQAKELIKVNWLKGVGLGNYTLALYDQDQEKQLSWAYQPVHTVFLLAAAELGIIGFALFVLIILNALERIYYFKIEKKLELLALFKKFNIGGIFDFYRSRFYWILGYSAIFLSLLVLMLFDHYFWTLYFGIILFWLMFGLWLKKISLSH